eukprot:15460962-Alexandrium_andersonii.AAC.1
MRGLWPTAKKPDVATRKSQPSTAESASSRAATPQPSNRRTSGTSPFGPTARQRSPFSSGHSA